MHLLMVIQKSNVVQHQLAKEGEEDPTGREQSPITWSIQSEPSGDHTLRFLLQPLGTEHQSGATVLLHLRDLKLAAELASDLSSVCTDHSCSWS